MAGRRKGRIIAFQALYAWDVSRRSLEDLLAFDWVEDDKRERLGEEGMAFPRLIIAGAIEHIEEIDRNIAENLTNWDFEPVEQGGSRDSPDERVFALVPA